MKEEFPTYYMYTGPGGVSSGFTKYKIYKVRNPLNLEEERNFIDNRGIQNGFSPLNSEYFKPVTELEWLMQHGIIPVKSSIHKLSDLLTNLKIQ